MSNKRIRRSSIEGQKGKYLVVVSFDDNSGNDAEFGTFAEAVAWLETQGGEVGTDEQGS